MNKIILVIDGMTCSACSNGLEKYLNKQEGIISASVNLVMANATIEYDEAILDIGKIEKFVAEAGFKSLGEFNGDIVENKNKHERAKFIAFLILSIILLYVSMGHMVGLPIIEFFDMRANPLIYTLALFLLTIPFVIYGFDIIKNGYKNLIHKTPNMDTLVSIGVISSILYSLFSAYMIIKGNHNYVEKLYFESAAIVIFFVKFGRYIDGISKDKTKEAIKKLVKITPNNATIKIDGNEKKVTIDEVKKGDILVCKPGEKIAVDGKILSGKAHLDESFITGESKPLVKTIGNNVVAGSMNYDGYLEYSAEKIGKESTISEVVKLVLEATNTKAPIAKIADKVSGYFVPIIILLAIITFFVYLMLGFDFNTALNVFVTILVVACPCSLGLATPLAIVVSEGLCIENGILVKKSSVLESARLIDTIIFDKTGTLTYGTLKVAKVFNYSKISENELLKKVGSLECKSSHPIGNAFVSYLKENNIDVIQVEKFEEISGYGIIGLIDKKEIIVGNSKLLSKYNIKNNHLNDEKMLARDGNSIVYVVEEGKIMALIGVNDVVRENASDVVNILKQNGIKTIMVTGDNNETAKNIAEKIGITDVVAEVLPSKKLEIIKELKSKNRYVMMCGDGINDSPALAMSDIGVSVNSGTDIAMDSSDVILTRNDLYSVINLINISKKTVRNIKQNLFWAFFYNVLMIPIAMGILKPLGVSINPMIASFAMVFSSLTVILNALRLRSLKMKNK